MPGPIFGWATMTMFGFFAPALFFTGAALVSYQKLMIETNKWFVKALWSTVKRKESDVNAAARDQ